jgi:predicted AAA+ superfamily ATPase
MEMEKLNRFNEWWSTGRVREGLLRPYKREIFHRISGYMKDRQALLVYGLRRVGKTTLFYQIIQKLLDEGTGKKRILYFSFDDTSADLDDLFRTYEKEVLKSRIEKAGRIYVFLDEIHKFEGWQNRIKIFYDLYPNMKFFISGSAHIIIQRKAKESLAGRMYDFLLNPLSFREFIDLKGIKFGFSEWKIHERQITAVFSDYLRKGGFPEILDEEDDEKVSSYIKNAVIDRIALIDLPSEFGLKDTELLKTIIEMVSVNPGMIVNYDSLSRDLKKSKPTIMSYFQYLEYALVLKTISNLRPGFLSTSRKMKKCYPSSTSFPFLYLRDPDSAQMGKIAETLVLQECGFEHYTRDKKLEVDFILKRGKRIVPVEVKYGKAENEKFMEALGQLGLDFGIIVTKDISGEAKSGNKRIIMVPAWVFILFPDRFLPE